MSRRGHWTTFFAPFLLMIVLCALSAGCEKSKEERTKAGESTGTSGEAGKADEDPTRPHEAGTESKEATSTNSQASTQGSDDVDSPGVHKTRSGTALAFSPGMSKEETRNIIRQAVAARQVEVIGEQKETRTLGESQVEVLVEELEPASKQIESFRLTHFGDSLVGVVVNYAESDRNRVAALTQEHGEATRNKGWVGWWNREQALIVQASPDGKTYEVFDLAAARQHVPDIDLFMLESWRRRYVEPPPWGRELMQDNQPPSTGGSQPGGPP